MKNILAIILIALSINIVAQDTISKKFSMGFGPIWESAKWGGNANISYAISKKFNLRMKGIYAPGKDVKFYNHSYYGGIQTKPTTDISLSANYYILGNTNQNGKAALYVGLGLGYLQQISNTAYLYPGNLFSSNNSVGSYLEKDVSKGLAANGSVGAAFKLGPGKIYIEGYFSMSFIGNTYTTFTFMNNVINPVTSSNLQVNKYKEDFDKEGFLFFNAGYIIPF